MSDLSKLSRLIDATTADNTNLKLKLLEQRINELEDVVEELCMIIDADVTDETDSEDELKTAETIVGVVKALKKPNNTTKKTSNKRSKKKNTL